MKLSEILVSGVPPTIGTFLATRLAERLGEDFLVGPLELQRDDFSEVTTLIWQVRKGNVRLKGTVRTADPCTSPSWLTWFEGVVEQLVPVIRQAYADEFPVDVVV